MRAFFYSIILLSFLFLTACSTEQQAQLIDTDLLSDASLLDSYVTYPNERIGFEADGLTTQADTDLELTLSATVSSPVYKGQTLQATSVALTNDYAVVSYNTKGQQYLGGLDVIDISDKQEPKLRTRLIYLSADVNAVSVHDNNVYAVLATENEKSSYTALLQVLPLNSNGSVELSVNKGMKVIGLKGYVGTSVTVTDKVLVTSGDNAGLSILDIPSLKEASFIELDDARWVDQQGRYTAVLQGTPGRLSIFNEDMTLEQEISLDGLDIPEAKSSVTLLGTTAFVATGSQGAVLVDLSSGELLSELPVAEGFSTNAITADSNFVFVAGADNGIYAAYADHTFEQPVLEKVNLNTLGKLALKDFDSANHIALDGSTLVVAAGLGGVRIIELGVQPLSLESVGKCEWQVKNPNNFPVSFHWQAEDNSAEGYQIAKENSETNFRTADVKKGLKLSVNNKQISKADSKYSCGEEEAKADVEFKIVKDWFNNNGREYGFQAEIRLTNNSNETIEDWEISFTKDAKFYSVWGASFKSKNDEVTLKALSWNEEIKPGQSITIGMTGTAKEAFDSVEDLKTKLKFD